jgi:hypothetical protein
VNGSNNSYHRKNSKGNQKTRNKSNHKKSTKPAEIAISHCPKGYITYPNGVQIYLPLSSVLNYMEYIDL